MLMFFNVNLKNTYNLGHNILEIYNVLVQVRVATIKTKLVIQYGKLGIQFAPQVAEWLKTLKIRNFV